MSRASALARGRGAADLGMTDTCIITRVDPNAAATVPDPVTLVIPPRARITVYSGPCRVQVTSVIANSTSSDAGERSTTVQGSELQLPVAGTGDVSVTDVAKITASAHDAELVDREFTIVARHEKSQATARRLRVIEVTG